MQVICISTKDHPECDRQWDLTDPQVGDICQVVETVYLYAGMRKCLCYILKGYHEDENGYQTENFAVISSIDELELVNEKEVVC